MNHHRRKMLDARGYLSSCRPTRGGRRQKIRLLRIYECMRARCRCPGHAWFENYGGRGIELRWRSFAEFRAWACAELRERYRGLHSECSVDRRDSDGHYEPGNCRLVPVEANRAQKYFIPHRYRNEAPSTEGA